MDSRLRALKRAIVDDETAARYVAACVQAGINTEHRVRVAALLGSKVAALLEPEVYNEHLSSAAWWQIERGTDLLTPDEVKEVRKHLGLEKGSWDLAYQMMRHRTAQGGLNYIDAVRYQKELLAAILLQLPEV